MPASRFDPRAVFDPDVAGLLGRDPGTYASRLGLADNRMRLAALDRVVGAGLAALGLGAGLRGALGLRHLVRGTWGQPPRVAPAYDQYQLAYAVPEEKDKRPKQAAAIPPPATSAVPGLTAPAPSLADLAARVPVADAVGGGGGGGGDAGPLSYLAALARRSLGGDAPSRPAVLGGLMDAAGLMRDPSNYNWGPLKRLVTRSGDAQGPWGVPLFYPALGAAVLGGGYAGYRGMDALLDRSRTLEQETELERARRRYAAALAGRIKGAAAADPLAGLDRLVDVAVAARDAARSKRAGWGDTAWGLGLGTLLTAMAASAAVGATQSYKRTRKRSPDKAVLDALQERHRRLFAAEPPPLLLDVKRAADMPAQAAADLRRQLDQRRSQLWAQIRAQLGQEGPAAASPPPSSSSSATSSDPPPPPLSRLTQDAGGLDPGQAR